MKPIKRRWRWVVLAIALAVAGMAALELARQRQLTAYDHLERALSARDEGQIQAMDRHLAKVRKALPKLGSSEDFRRHQRPMQELLDKLHMPVLPDLTGLDEDGQNLFHRFLNELRQKPHEAESYGRLGLLCEAQLMPEQAAALYRRAVELAPSDAQWHYQLGNLLAASGDPSDAETAFRTSAELDPTYAQVWLRLAWLEADPAVALTHIDRYIEYRPADPFGFVSRARLHHAAGRWSAMGLDLEQAAEFGPIGAGGHRLLAAHLRHLGRDADADFHTAMSRKRQPGDSLDDPLAARTRSLVTYSDPEFTRFLGLVGSGRCGEAMTRAKDLLARFADDRPNHGRLCAAVALCLYRSRNYAEAESYSLMAKEAFPQDPPVLALLGLIQLNQGRLDDAMAQAEDLLAAHPDSPEGLHLRALTQISLGVRQNDPNQRLEHAVADLERCVSRDPLNVEYLKVLASAHAMLEHWQEADRIIAQALRVSPQDPGLRTIGKRIQTRASFR